MTFVFVVVGVVFAFINFPVFPLIPLISISIGAFPTERSLTVHIASSVFSPK